MAGSGTIHLRNEAETLLQVSDLEVTYPVRGGGIVQAVSGVSFDVQPGETLGIVGESGCGKSTIGRATMRLLPVDAGKVTFEGRDLLSLGRRDLRASRSHLQMIFQDPISSLNPRMTVLELVAEGLHISGGWSAEEIVTRVRQSLDAVGLDYDRSAERRPRELSGGQCQRVGIARALAVDPVLLVCDEPVSALDVSVQAQIVNLLLDIQIESRLSMIFIAHDLSVIEQVAHRVLVLYMGKVCEVGTPASIYHQPAHPYTKLLLSSVPVPDPHLQSKPTIVGGEMPSPLDPPSGCRFRTRCPLADELCETEEPIVEEYAPGHFVACHHHDRSTART